jgi:hypothetical protein
MVAVNISVHSQSVWVLLEDESADLCNCRVVYAVQVAYTLLVLHENSLSERFLTVLSHCANKYDTHACSSDNIFVLNSR